MVGPDRPHRDDGLDRDGDGLTTEQELRCGTSPTNADTDSDGVSVSDEDADKDGLSNAASTPRTQTQVPTGVRTAAKTPTETASKTEWSSERLDWTHGARMQTATAAISTAWGGYHKKDAAVDNPLCKTCLAPGT